jgi:hypothetical protein
VERLETIATRIASALGGSVELARVGSQKPEPEAGVPVRESLTGGGYGKEQAETR